jgi:hypothetical protein
MFVSAQTTTGASRKLAHRLGTDRQIDGFGSAIRAPAKQFGEHK